MRETQFIHQNQDKWKNFEKTLEGEVHDADELRDLFVHITDDLAYSRTFYPNRSVRVYLNGLAQRIFLKLYKSRKAPMTQLMRFWSEDLPREIHEARWAFRLAFIVFMVSVGIGMLSCAMDPEFAEVVLGDTYVEMTRTNIETGDPMAVYKERGQFGMFLGITLNNIKVALLAFTTGVLFGVGPLLILIGNGIMLGCFQFFFIIEGLFWESFLTIWIHGTLEISAIIIAGAAGITMGRGLAFPGTYTRLQAFQQSARRAAKIMLGTVPLFIIAGFLEAYLTRQTETPDVIRGLFILLCLGFVLVYFVWYPWFRTKFGVTDVKKEHQQIPVSKPFTMDFGQIKSVGEIFGEVFGLIRKNSGKIWGLLFGSAFLYTLGIALVTTQEPEVLFPYRFESWFLNLHNLNLLFSFRNGQWIVPLLGGGMIFVMALLAFRIVDREQQISAHKFAPIGLLFGVLSILACAGNQSDIAILLILFVLPMAMLATYVAYLFPLKPLEVASKTLGYGFKSYMRLMGLGGLFLLLGWILFSVVNTFVGQFFFQIINWLVSADQVVLDKYSVWLTTFIFASIGNLIWLLLLLAFGILYYTLREISEATILNERIESIGQTKRIRGLERE